MAEATEGEAGRARILVIDDEEILLKSCKRTLEPAGHEVVTAQSPKDGFRILETASFDLVLSDLKMPNIDGLEVLKHVKGNWPDTEVIIMTGHGTVSTAVSAMKLGVYDYIEKPFTPDTLSIIVEKALERKKLYRENARLKSQLKSLYIKNVIGKSPAMEGIFKLIASVAPTSGTVLITGESGTGKELVARAIHYNSPRQENPFVVVDCGTFPENLIESELFGFVKGAFTGAQETRKGLIETADTGTLFLDEIGNLPLALQAKLLRVLQEREFRPVGGKKTCNVDIRFIAATNLDLKKMVGEGTFREDLFYRINIFPIRVPSLRERREDIPLLAYHFLEKFSLELGKEVKHISAAAMGVLLGQEWPGNVRELENTINRAVLLCGGDTVNPGHLLSLEPTADNDVPRTLGELKILKRDLRNASIERIERSFILNALQRNDWNITRAAREVGMQRTNFHALIRKHNIDAKGERSS